MGENVIYLGNNLDILPTIPGGSVDLIYIDPPFNTGKIQQRTQIRTVRDEPTAIEWAFKARNIEPKLSGPKVSLTISMISWSFSGHAY